MSPIAVDVAKATVVDPLIRHLLGLVKRPEISNENLLENLLREIAQKLRDKPPTGNLLYRFLNPAEQIRYRQQITNKSIRAVPADRFMIGILCDFDLTVQQKQVDRAALPGTRLFRAARLLQVDFNEESVTRRYLDDLESFMWVIVVNTTMYPAEERVRCRFTAEIRDWEKTARCSTVGAQKYSWIAKDSLAYPTTPTHKKTWSLLAWLVRLIKQTRNSERRKGGGHRNVAEVDERAQDAEYYKAIVEGEKEEDGCRLRRQIQKAQDEYARGLPSGEGCFQA